MTAQRACLALAVAFAAATIPASALDLGDPAPKLSISKWVTGKPVKLADGKGKNVYVIEFWATWCPPCQASIPHLTDLQKKYKDKGVVFIGVTGEDAATVSKFVKTRGRKMDYTVAVDKDWATAKAYMLAFGVETIPHAFIVDKQGKLVWQGSPLDPEMARRIKAEAGTTKKK